MKKALLLGAGMTAKPLAEYLLNNNIELTIASKTLANAAALAEAHPQGHAIQWHTNERNVLEQLVEQHHVVISLLPAAHHAEVAELCIKHGRNMVSTSYTSPEMAALDASARKAGVLILNEMGLAPGLDHMTAQRIISQVHKAGGKVLELYSLSGALPAPEAADNPFRYTFSCSPNDVLHETNQSAVYLKHGEKTALAAEDTFKNPMQIEFPELGAMEAFPKRNSLDYIERYQIPEAETFFRGTLRYKTWCEIMDALKTLGLLSDTPESFEGKTYKKIMARKVGVYPANMKEKVAERLHLDISSPAILAMEWLGLFSDFLVRMNHGSMFDLVLERMVKKMLRPAEARDLALLMHSFLIQHADGSREVIKSQLLHYGTAKHTATAQTATLPAAIATQLMLQQEISGSGVCIPTDPAIYNPILNELEKLGISTTDEWDLPETAKLQ